MVQHNRDACEKHTVLDYGEARQEPVRRLVPRSGSTEVVSEAGTPGDGHGAVGNAGYPNYHKDG